MSSKVKILCVTVFLLVDAILIAWMFDHRNERAADDDSDVTTDMVMTVDRTVTLMRSGSYTLLRVHRSDCSGRTRPKLEVANSSLESFREAGLPVGKDQQLAIRSVLAVAATSRDDLSLLATNRDCQPVGYVSEDAGETWKPAEVTFDWYISPDGKSVTSRYRTSSPGCVPISLAAKNSVVARVVCESGSLVVTGNGGASWAPLSTLTDLRAVSFTGMLQGVALASSDECESQAYRTVDGGRHWYRIGCISKDARVQSMLGATQGLIATDGSRVWTSDDRGVTWTEVVAPE